MSSNDLKATSPVDGAIDMKKRKRLNQIAAKQKQQEQ